MASVEKPIIDWAVVLANRMPADFYAAQRRKAALTIAKSAFHFITLGTYSPLDEAANLGWGDALNMRATFRDGADRKAASLLTVPQVAEPIEANGSVSLLYRSGRRLITKGRLVDTSTIIVVDAVAKQDDSQAVGWQFDVTNGTPGNFGLRSKFYFQTHPSFKDGEETLCLGDMAAIDERGNYHSPEDYAPKPYGHLYNETAFYALAERLFGAVESGFSFPEGTKHTSVI